MFTVKLSRGHVTKIVMAEEVNVYPVGHAEGSDRDPKKRTNEVREVAVVVGGRSNAFYIAKSWEPRPVGFADEVDFWDAAYIENANGATTEVVRPY